LVLTAHVRLRITLRGHSVRSAAPNDQTLFAEGQEEFLPVNLDINESKSVSLPRVKSFKSEVEVKHSIMSIVRGKKMRALIVARASMTNRGVFSRENCSFAEQFKYEVSAAN